MQVKKILITVLVVLILATSGCQYLLPPVVTGGSVEIQTSEQVVTPEVEEVGETITIEIIPPGCAPGCDQ